MAKKGIDKYGIITEFSIIPIDIKEIDYTAVDFFYDFFIKISYVKGYFTKNIIKEEFISLIFSNPYFFSSLVTGRIINLLMWKLIENEPNLQIGKTK